MFKYAHTCNRLGCILHVSKSFFRMMFLHVSNKICCIKWLLLFPLERMAFQTLQVAVTLLWVSNLNYFHKADISIVYSFEPYASGSLQHVTEPYKPAGDVNRADGGDETNPTLDRAAIANTDQVKEKISESDLWYRLRNTCKRSQESASDPRTVRRDI